VPLSDRLKGDSPTGESEDWTYDQKKPERKRGRACRPRDGGEKRGTSPHGIQINKKLHRTWGTSVTAESREGKFGSRVCAGTRGIIRSQWPSVTMRPTERVRIRGENTRKKRRRKWLRSGFGKRTWWCSGKIINRGERNFFRWKKVKVRVCIVFAFKRKNVDRVRA